MSGRNANLKLTFTFRSLLVAVTFIILASLPLPSGAAAGKPHNAKLPMRYDDQMSDLAEQRHQWWTPLPVLMGDTNEVPTLLKMLSSSNPNSRARSAFLLGQIGSKATIGALVNHLKDADQNVRLQCGIALACMGDLRGIPQCAQAISISPEWMKYYAVYGLWRTNSLAGRQVLKSISAKKQGNLISAAIIGALSTRYVESPVRVPASMKTSSGLTEEQVISNAVNAFISEADWWFHDGYYDQAIRCLHVQVFLDPKYSEGYANMAYYEWSLGRDQRAVAILKQGISALPNDPAMYFELGEHYYLTKNYKLAESPLNKATDLSDSVTYRKVYAHCLERLGKLKESVAQWEILAKANPTDGAILLNRDRVKKLIGARR